MKDLAVYIHYPFCKSKCPYCDFNSHVREGVNEDIWRSAYLEELDKYKDLGARNITSIFFGGGTPSLMPPKTVEAIIERIGKNWNLDKNAEITLEANPTSVEYEKFKSFRAAGVNRVSIGVQSFDEKELKFLGREHSSAEAVKAIEYARDTFPRYSFDLIYALPEQDLNRWKTQLTEALKLAGSHISLYQLTIEENTNFYHRKVPTPASDLAAEFYEVTQEICNAAGLPAYEISNHAKPGEESRHNLAYWQYGEYLGIGPGAHGRINGFATMQTKSPEKWLEKRIAENTELTEREKFEEKIMMGMRLKNGVNTENLKNLKPLEAEGFIEISGDLVKPTAKGWLLLNKVTHMLLGY